MTKRNLLFFSAMLSSALLVFGVPFSPAQTKPTVNEIVTSMIAWEVDASAHRQLFEYVSLERSERTGGKLWMEHVVETTVGRVRFLIAEDQIPLSPNRVAQERGRLANDIANPVSFEAREKAQKDDEVHARQMLTLLSKAFVLENLRESGDDWRIDFAPSPDYSPSGIEEKVLHGMSGFLLIDRKHLRMHSIEGRMSDDVHIGFGLSATVHAGSSFSSLKAPFQEQWRTVHVVSDIRGKAALFKTIAKNQDVTRSRFHRLDLPLALTQAVALAEQPVADALRSILVGSDSGGVSIPMFLNGFFSVAAMMQPPRSAEK